MIFRLQDLPKLKVEDFILGPATKIDAAGVAAMLADKGTKRICFTGPHANSLREWREGKSYSHTLVLPFRKTIEPILRESVAGLMFKDSQFGVTGYIPPEGYEAVRAWIQKQGDTVFLRDCLDLSVAMGLTMAEEGVRTEIGQIEYNAKYAEDAAAAAELQGRMADAIARLPYFRDAELIACIPARKGKNYDLPSMLAEGVAAKLNKRLISAGEWTGEKKQLKDQPVEVKWQALSDAGFKASAEEISGLDVVLIDDLYQSGTTMHFVAASLKARGVKRVFGMSVVKSWRNTDNQ